MRAKFATLLAGFVLSIIPLLLTISILRCFAVYRFFVRRYLTRKYGEWINFLDGPDTVVSLNDPIRRIVFDGVQIIKGSFDLEAFKERVQKLWVDQVNIDGTWKHLKLRQSLHRELGYSFWLPDPDFRIEDHVVIYNGPQPKTSEDLHRSFTVLTNQPLPPGKSPWQWVIIPLPTKFPGLEPKPHHVAFCRFHHSVTDSISGLRLMYQLFDDPVDDFLHITPKAGIWDMVKGTFEAFCLGPVEDFESVLDREEDHILNPKTLTGFNLTGFTVPIPMDRFKQMEEITGASIEDIVLATLTGALRSHFVDEAASVPHYVNFLLPISMHDFIRSPVLKNNFSIATIKLPVGQSRPLERLMETKRLIEEAKSSPAVMFNYLFMLKGLGSVLPSWLMGPLVGLQKATGVVVSLPGPREKCTELGKELVSMCYLVPPVKGLGVSAICIQGKVQFGLRVDGSVMRNQMVLDKFLLSINKEFEELENIFNPSDIEVISTHL